MDYKIKIKTDPQFLDLFKKIEKSKVDIPAHVSECFSVKMLDLEAFKWFSENLKKIDGPPLHTLITEDSIVLPSPPIVESSPEYKEKMRKLEQRLKNKEYDAMTKNVDFRRVRLPEDTISYQIKQINRQLIAVLQFVISTAAGFLFGFLGIELMLSTTFDLGFKLLLGIICALIIALAEIYFLAKKLSEDFESLDTTGGKVHQD
ncbi:uncharacterized protein LOC100164954 isoform X1 [Acyrthosiphon pisum]|uniref:Transmembrane protein 199 n=1 Tax=Acyrthosiphon pisum TaxID=7029 RepID=A0A8R2A9I1_ACYPI|nr:uncharacterized protein LOC100164954 isoform X1 [Acyrthosiphon pisum]|eukprot:XP_003246485.2 PREDICTED: uncharacterized protein LOC100164954 isoform X1 [Acyrthosiphon pisum]